MYHLLQFLKYKQSKILIPFCIAYKGGNKRRVRTFAKTKPKDLPRDYGCEFCFTTDVVVCNMLCCVSYAVLFPCSQKGQG